MGPSSFFASPPTLAGADSSSRSDLFGGQQGLAQKVGHRSEYCRFRGSSGTGVSFAGGLLSATYPLGRRAKLSVATPFSFILFYEVLTLIAALPASTTQSIANQFEVVSLIFIRDVFKDIAAASQNGWHHEQFHQALPLFVDMCSGLVMFLLVAIFQYVALKRGKRAGTAELSTGLKKFIAQKKLVAIGLTVLLLSMAVYNLGIVIVHFYRSLMAGHCITPEPNAFFYNDVFTVMIFTDVLILILSLVVSGRYEMVFRNAAFVLSIILLRFSLTEDRPYGAPLALFAMVFGILTLLVFNVT
jgi:hypothetical protein